MPALLLEGIRQNSYKESVRDLKKYRDIWKIFKKLLKHLRIVMSFGITIPDICR